MSEKLEDQDLPASNEPTDTQHDRLALAYDLIAKHGAAHECPMCRNTNWIGIPNAPIGEDDQYHDGPGIPIIQTTGLIAGKQSAREASHAALVGSIPVATFVCDKCGFVRSHVLFPGHLGLSKERNGLWTSAFYPNGTAEEPVVLSEGPAKDDAK